MTRIIVYGNCQSGPIGRLLESVSPSIKLIRVPPVHTIKPDQFSDVENSFRSADIVLSQNVGNKFGQMSTDALKTQSGHREWITFPTLYFGGIFPHLTYLRSESGAPLKGPLADYHDSRILRSFLSNETQKQCVDRSRNKEPTLCASNFEKSILESTRRESDLPIKIINFLLEKVRAVRTFYTFNHPSNIIMWEVVLQFAKLTGIAVNPSARPPVNPYLGEISAGIPPEMVDAVGLNFVESDYRVNGQIVPFETLVADFYRIYALTPRLEAFASKAA